MVTTVDPHREAGQRSQGVGRLYLTCTLAGARYLIPTSAVREVEEVGAITPVPATPSWLRGVMNLRGTIIAVVDLAHFLGLISEPAGWTEALVCTTGTPGRDTDDDFLLALSVEAVSNIRTLTPADILPLPEQGTGEATRYLSGFYRAPSRDGDATELHGVLDLDTLLGALVLDQQGALGENR